MAQKLYFLAFDKQDKEDLWVTDGTTTEAVGGLGDIGVSGVGNEGLGPEFITAFGQQMIFAGGDALDDAEANGLWLTDGSMGGTTEVGGVSPGSPKSSVITNADPNGLNPTDFVAFGTKALFFGLDSSSFEGLWSTDGTVGNTLELGGLENGQIMGRGTNWDPLNFFAFNNEVLFDAYDSSDGGSSYIGLWITDGTTAGTVEIGGPGAEQIPTSGVSNFEATDYIQLGDSVLFNDIDSAGDQGLWITDGTAAGTTEIGGLHNDDIVGAGKNTDFGDGLQNAVRFGARIFMSGTDNDGATGLWTTDGTALSTTEVGGFDDAGLTAYEQHPSSLGLQPTDLTVNGQQVLFDGTDAIGFRELWVSDGTVTGTYEIGGESPDGQLGTEAVNGLDPSSIVSLGNGKAVFIGMDDSNGQNSGKPTLWVTGGTQATTRELGGSDNLGISGINSTGFDFTSALVGGDGLAYFIGEDTAGNQVLWETDGTVGGTKVVAATDGNAPATGLDPSSMTLANPPSSEDNFSAGGENINLNNVPGESANLSNTQNDWDTVTGSNGTLSLTTAQAFVVGGGLLITLSSLGNALNLSKTNGNKDSIYGTKGAITLSGAQADVYGVKNNITFASGTTGNVVYLYDTQGNWDGVTGSNGVIYLTSAMANVTGGGDTVNFNGGTGDNVSLYSTNGAWDTVYATGGEIEVTTSQVSVVGGQNTINATAASSISLYSTGGKWDTVNATGAYVYLTGAQASVIGGGDTIYFNGGTGDNVSLYSTNGAWDTVYATGGEIEVTKSQVSVIGGQNTISATAGSSISLYSTGGKWDTVDATGAYVYLTGAQASILGGGDTVNATNGSSASLYNTGGAWDLFNGSACNVILTNAHASVVGGGDTITLDTKSSLSLSGTSGNWDSVAASGDTITATTAQAAITGNGDIIFGNAGSNVSLAGTSGVFDTFYGSNDGVILSNAQASIIGGYDTISASAGSTISLYSTDGHADVVNGSNDALYATSAQASINGSAETVYLTGQSSLTLNGQYFALNFAAKMGEDEVADFNATDVLHLSVSDWTSFAALKSSGDLVQSGPDTIIKVDASDSVTLSGVQATSLTASEFKFA